MRVRRSGPRLGLGSDRVDPERARFATVGDVLRYFGDLHGFTHAQLAARCGVGRVQVTRWLNGDREPPLSKLGALLAPLGWKPMIVLERTEEAVSNLTMEPASLGELLDYDIAEMLGTVRAGVEAGFDVVVGGEVAAVLQDVPVPTRHLVLHVRPEHVIPFLRLATKRWQDATQVDGQWRLRHGPVSADVVSAEVRPASRIVTDHNGLPIAVVDLKELLSDATGIGPTVRRIAARLSRPEHRPGG